MFKVFHSLKCFPNKWRNWNLTKTYVSKWKPLNKKIVYTFWKRLREKRFSVWPLMFKIKPRSLSFTKRMIKSNIFYTFNGQYFMNYVVNGFEDIYRLIWVLPSNLFLIHSSTIQNRCNVSLHSIPLHETQEDLSKV